MVKVSVIVPIFNVQEHLEKCIDSIVNQSLRDIEIILINDGSTDNSLNICENYKNSDDRIKLINKANSGVSSSRNIGIDISNGEYICFVDSDDWIETTMIEDLYKLAKKDNSDICICNYYRSYTNNKDSINLCAEKKYLDNKDTINKFMGRLIGKESFNDNDNAYLFRAPWAKLFKTDMIKLNNIRFKEELSIGEDFIFNLEAISKSYSISINSNAYYNYMCNEESVMESYKKDCLNKYKNLIQSIEKFLLENNYIDKFNDRFIITKLECITFTILNECSSKNSKTIHEKINYIKTICSDKFVKKIIDEINYNRLDYKRKFLIYLIKNEMAFIIYLYYTLKK